MTQMSLQARVCASHTCAVSASPPPLPTSPLPVCRSINFILSSMLFNVVPTGLEIGLVSGIMVSAPSILSLS